MHKYGLSQLLKGKESTCNTEVAGDACSIPRLERSPGGGHGNPLQYSYLENPTDRGSLAGHSSWGRKESDTTERLTLPLLLLIYLVRQVFPFSTCGH